MYIILCILFNTCRDFKEATQCLPSVALWICRTTIWHSKNDYMILLNSHFFMATNPLIWGEKFQVLPTWHDAWLPYNTYVTLFEILGSRSCTVTTPGSWFWMGTTIWHSQVRFLLLYKFISMTWSLRWEEFWVHWNFLIVLVKDMRFLFKIYRCFTSALCLFTFWRLLIHFKSQKSSFFCLLLNTRIKNIKRSSHRLNTILP